MKRPLQIKHEEINEAETYEELEEATGKIDLLNLAFSSLYSRLQENQIRKSNDNETAEKKRKIQVENFKQKGHRLQHEFNLDITEDLQDITDISDQEDPVSKPLKTAISKPKKKSRLKLWNKRGWAVVVDYQKEPIGIDPDECKRI